MSERESASPAVNDQQQCESVFKFNSIHSLLRRYKLIIMLQIKRVEIQSVFQLAPRDHGTMIIPRSRKFDYVLIIPKFRVLLIFQFRQIGFTLRLQQQYKQSIKLSNVITGTTNIRFNFLPLNSTVGQNLHARTNSKFPNKKD